MGMEMYSQCERSLRLYIARADSAVTAAFRYGPYVCHFSLTPIVPEQEKEANASQYSSSDSYMVLRDNIKDFYSKQAARYMLRAQFVSDLKQQPVEDASTSWDEFFSPWHDLAVLEFPPQETYSDKRRTWWDEKIALSPFNGLVAHTPLGSVNRLRKRVYEASRKYRAQKNGDLIDEPYFPKSVDEMPE
jgi:hypothetical protein